MDKKAKAEAKRVRRTQRKLGGDESDSPENPDLDLDAVDADSETPDHVPETGVEP